MRRKRPSENAPVISSEIMDCAKRSLKTDRPVLVAKCVVCGSECAPNSTEDLCWVCRRLKVSAWDDADHQAPAQE